MDCVQVQCQVAFLYFLPPGSLFFLQFSPYLCLTCLSNLALEAFSPWHLSQLLQFPSYIHLVSYYFHWFICPPLPWECSDSRPRERLRYLLGPCQYRSNHSTQQYTLEMAGRADGAYWSQISSSFQNTVYQTPNRYKIQILTVKGGHSANSRLISLKFCLKNSNCLALYYLW